MFKTNQDNARCTLIQSAKDGGMGGKMQRSPDQSAMNVRWNLSCFYSELDDPQIDADINQFEQLAAKFNADYCGRLNTKLAEALEEYARLDRLADKPLDYLFLRQSLTTGDQEIKKRLGETTERIMMAAGQHLTFFQLEVCALDWADIDRQAQESDFVRKHLPLINKMRLFKDHLLSEEVEQALAKRSPFGPGSWAQFFDEVEADLRVNLPDGEFTLTRALHDLSEERDAKTRARILQGIHDAFDGFFLKYSTETLMNTVRAKALEDAERGYPHPMAARNTANMMSDATVEALHEAVARVAAPIMQQHYRLKAAHLGLERLAWSDRNAPLPFSDDTVIPFDEARRIVDAAYRSFSPTLADMIKEQYRLGRIDAPHYEGKRGGAFNASLCMLDGTPMTFTFLNHLGSVRDVATLAHELGHGVHGLLAGHAQGNLMMHAPMAYAETASIFGEMVTFKYLMKDLEAKQNWQGALNLIMGKSDDFANSVVRQVGFSEFERRVHGADKRLSADDLSRIWIETTYDLYGPDGEVFTYENAERLWAYVSHFHRPFYVYAYATGEIFTQSLFARHEEFGDDFEPMYLELLRAGMTKNAVELLKPFGLNPTDSEFWEAGIKVSFGRWVEEAIRLSAKMGVTI